MSARVQTMLLPNGRFILIFDGMPGIGLGPVYTEDWVPTREKLLETSGAVCVLRFDHRVDVVS